MKQVLLIWTESNPSTMEKEYLLLNGLEKSGVKTYALGFSHSKSNKEYFEKVYAKNALYEYGYGNERSLYQGRNYIEKLYNNLFLLIWFSISLYKTLRARPTSTIIIPPNPIELTLPAVILGKLFGIKVVPNIMEYEPSLPSFHTRKNILSRWSWMLITKYSDAFIVISRFLEEKLRLFSHKPLFRLPAILPSRSGGDRYDSVDCNHVLSGIPGGTAPVLIFASSPAYDDLLGFSIDALSHLRDRDFQLIITGGYSSTAQKLWMAKARAAGLDGKLSFSGFLSDKGMYELQLCSKALLMPLLDSERHRARFPQKILGYMRLGKPVITTKVGEMGEFFEDMVTVMMDKSVTTYGYSEKIRFLLDHPDLAEAVGRRGADYVESRFNDSALGKQLAGFLLGLSA